MSASPLSRAASSEELYKIRASRVSRDFPISTDQSNALQYKVMKTWERLSQDRGNPALETKLDLLLKEKKDLKSLQSQYLITANKLNKDEIAFLRSFSESNGNLDIIANTNLLTKKEKCNFISFFFITGREFSWENRSFLCRTDLLSLDVKDNLLQIRYESAPVSAI